MEVEEDRVGLFARCVGKRQAGLALSKGALRRICCTHFLYPFEMRCLVAVRGERGTLPSFPVVDAVPVTGSSCMEILSF